MKLIVDFPDDLKTSESCLNYFGAWSGKLTEIFKTAIPYVNPTGCLISRDVLKMKIKSYDEDQWAEGETLGAYTIISYIDDATPVDPERHAVWKSLFNGKGGHECSACGNYAPSTWSGTEKLSRYCPECGARMHKGVIDV